MEPGILLLYFVIKQEKKGSKIFATRSTNQLSSGNIAMVT